MSTGAYIADALHAAGVNRVYGILGHAVNGFTDALRASERIRWVNTQHEEAAALTAGAEATLTGKLAVCSVSCGPDNLHLIDGLLDCHRNGVPVLAIVTHIQGIRTGLEFTEAASPESLFRTCSHYVELVSTAAQLPKILALAMQVAITKRGVSVVVITSELVQQPTVSTLGTWINSKEPAQPRLIEDLQLQ